MHNEVFFGGINDCFAVFDVLRRFYYMIELNVNKCTVATSLDIIYLA